MSIPLHYQLLCSFVLQHSFLFCWIIGTRAQKKDKTCYWVVIVLCLIKCKFCLLFVQYKCWSLVIINSYPISKSFDYVSIHKLWLCTILNGVCYVILHNDVFCYMNNIFCCCTGLVNKFFTLCNYSGILINTPV